MLFDLAILLRLFAACYPVAFAWAAWAHIRAFEAYGQIAHQAVNPDLGAAIAHVVVASAVAGLSYTVAYHEVLFDGEVTRIEHVANSICVVLHWLVTLLLLVLSLPLLYPLTYEPLLWVSLVAFLAACPSSIRLLMGAA